MKPLTRFVTRHKFLTISVFVLLAAAASMIAVGAANAPVSSSVQVASCLKASASADDCIRFPTVSGSNLLGDELTLPTDFTGSYNFVIVSFDEKQTPRAQAWLPVIDRLSAQYPGFQYYNVPMMKSVAPLMRTFIMAGMNALVTDQHLRQITVMLFLDDKQVFLNALAIPDLDAIEVFLLNDAGEVLWRSRGDFTDEKGAELEQQLMQLGIRS